MKPTLFKNLFLLVAFLTCMPVFAFSLLDGGEGNGEVNRNGFQDLVAEFEGLWNKDASCVLCSSMTLDTPESKPVCDFAQMCNQLALSKDGKTIYQNDKGEIVPNYQLLDAAEKFIPCGEGMLEAEFKEQMKLNQSQMGLELAKLQKEMLQSINENHEETVFVLLSQEVLDQALNQNETLAGLPQLPGTAESGQSAIEKNLDQLLASVQKKNPDKAASLTLSKKTREVYIKKKMAEEKLAKGENPFKQDASATNETLKLVRKIEGDNPFLHTSLLMSSDVAGSKELVLENQKKYQKEVDRSFAIFQDLKKQMISFLQERSNKGDAASMRALATRLASVKFKAADLDMSLMANCPMANAYYSPYEHSITLCPQVLQLPSASLKAILAHELAHSIDPCISTDPLVELSNLEKRKDETLSPEPEVPGVYPYKVQVADNDHRVMMVGGIGSSLFAHETYSHFDMHTVSQGISGTQYPFARTMNCLTSAKAGGFRRLDKDSIKKKEELLTDSIKKMMQSGEEDPFIMRKMTAAKKLLTDMSQQKSACSMPGGDVQSQEQEAFADWLSSKIMAKDIAREKNSKEKKKIALESVLFLLASDCPVLRADIESKVDKFKSENPMCQMNGPESAGGSGNSSTDLLSSIFSRINDPHPYAVDRVNNIFWADPQFRDGLNCKKIAGAKSCE